MKKQMLVSMLAIVALSGSARAADRVDGLYEFELSGHDQSAGAWEMSALGAIGTPVVWSSTTSRSYVAGCHTQGDDVPRLTVSELQLGRSVTITPGKSDAGDLVVRVVLHESRLTGMRKGVSGECSVDLADVAETNYSGVKYLPLSGGEIAIPVESGRTAVLRVKPLRPNLNAL